MTSMFACDQAAARVQCVICFEKHPPNAGATCAAGHLHCGECFAKHVETKAAEETRLVAARHGKVSCALATNALGAKCTAAPFTNAIIARHVPEATFEKHVRARVRIEEARLVAEMGSGGGAAAQAADAVDNSVAAGRHHVVETILTLHCPRCDAAFLNFDACFALSCHNCPCRFCAYCLEDCGTTDEAAHRHVARCRYNLAGGGVYGTIAQFEEAQRRRRERMLREYLDSLPSNRLRSNVLAVCKRDLADLGIDSDAHMSKHPGRDMFDTADMLQALEASLVQQALEASVKEPGRLHEEHEDMHPVLLEGNVPEDVSYCMGIYTKVAGWTLNGRCVWRHVGAEDLVLYHTSFKCWSFGSADGAARNASKGLSSEDTARLPDKIRSSSWVAHSERKGGVYARPTVRTRRLVGAEFRGLIARQAEMHANEQAEALQVAQRAPAIVLEGVRDGPHADKMGIYCLVPGNAINRRAVWQAANGKDRFIFCGDGWCVSDRMSMEGAARGCWFVNCGGRKMLPTLGGPVWLAAKGPKKATDERAFAASQLTISVHGAPRDHAAESRSQQMYRVAQRKEHKQQLESEKATREHLKYPLTPHPQAWNTSRMIAGYHCCGSTDRASKYCCTLDSPHCIKNQAKAWPRHTHYDTRYGRW